MKRILSFAVLLLPLLSFSQITQGDGLRMPGDWNSFTNSLNMGGDFDFNLNTAGLRRWETTFQYTGTTGNQNFKFASGGSGNPWANQWAQVTGISLNTVTNVPWTTNGSVGNNSISVTNNNYYKVIWKDNGYAATDFIFMEISQAPVSISSVSAPNGVGLNQDVNISVTLSGTLAAEEKVFLVYTTDNYANRTALDITSSFSGTSGSGTIPAQAAGTNVDYYVMTSTIDMTGITATGENFDMRTITASSSQEYDVINAISNIGSTWNNGASWNGGAIPSDNDAVLIVNNITLDSDASIASLTIASGATFTASDGSPRILTISRDANTAATTITNDGGTWANGTGGSTVVFSGNPNSGDATHQTSGTLAFQNVTIEKESGATNNVGVDFQTNSSVSGTLKIGNGGYVSTAPPASFYGGSAILEFDQGSGATYNVGATDNSWSTTEVPQNITITSGTVTLQSSTRTAPGNLIVSTGATLNLEATDASNYAQLKIDGTITNNGTINHQMRFDGGWQMVAASMNATQASYFGAVGSDANGGTSNTQNLFSWDGTQYVNVVNNNAAITPGQGYFGYVGDFGFRDDGNNSNNTGAGIYTFTGTPNTSVTPSLTFATSTVTMSAGTNDGWNLIANPFTCALDFNTITLTNVNDAFYVYNPTDNTTGSYVSGSKAGTDPTIIAPMQSFWVQANAASPSLGTLTMAANGTVSSTPTFYKKNFDRLVLKTVSTQDSTAIDRTVISFVGQGTSKSYDGEWDAHKLYNSGKFPNIYSKYNGNEVSINGIDFGPNHPNADSIDIAFQAPNAGEVYEISIDKSYMLYPYDIMLEDKKLGTFTDLNQSSYQFPYDDNFVDRFVLHFSSKTVGLEHLANRNANSLQVWMHNGAVNYLANYEGAAQMDLLDLSGKKLWSAEVSFERDQQASLTLNRQLPAGIYLLRSQEGNGKVQTEKVYLK